MTEPGPLLGRHDAVPRRRWQWLLPLLIGLAVVGLVASLVVRAQQQRTTTARYALNSYLDAVEKGSTGRAYAMLCTKAKNRPSIAEFESKLARERADSGGVIGHKISDLTKRRDGTVLATYTVRFKRTYKWNAAALVKERGAWKLCGFKTIPRPENRVPLDDLPEPPGFGDTGNTTTTR